MPEDPNLARLQSAATLLGPLLDELLLVGGCVTGLLISDPGAATIRTTVDVDLVVEAYKYAEYGAFEARMRARGFVNGLEQDDPICRWRQNDVCVDLMPTGDFLGFTNRWYPSALASKVHVQLPNGIPLDHIDAPHFLATKLEALDSRGEGDPVSSHDAEDVILIIDGRPEVMDELAAASEDLRSHVAKGVRGLLDDQLFMDALSGFFDRAVAVERAMAVRQRMAILRGH